MSSTAQVSKAPKKTTTTRTRSSAPKPNREHMIAEAAYYRAQQRGFSGGDSMRDWLDAEVEIDQTLTKKPRKATAKK